MINFQIRCEAQDVFSDREVDLTPLKNVAHNYLARINDTLKSSQPNGILVGLYEHLDKVKTNDLFADFQIICVFCSFFVSCHLQYYLNVCRPLVSQYGLSCSAESAACRGILNGTKNPEQEQVIEMVFFPFQLNHFILFAFNFFCPLKPIHIHFHLAHSMQIIDFLSISLEICFATTFVCQIVYIHNIMSFQSCIFLDNVDWFCQRIQFSSGIWRHFY